MATTTLSTLLGLADVQTVNGTRALATVDLSQFEGLSAQELQAMQLIEQRVTNHLLNNLPYALNLEPGLYVAEDLSDLRDDLSNLNE